jgi:hypothetical protein
MLHLKKIIKYCPYCYNPLHQSDHPTNKLPNPTDFYSICKCLSRSCALSDAYTKFTITYHKDIVISSLMFVEIDNVYYGLGFNLIGNVTEVMKFGYTIEPDEDGYYGFPTCRSICCLNQVLKWDLYSIEDTKKVICRLLKIKVFS